MITVEEAQRRILAAFAPLPAEEVALAEARGRVLAADLAARRTQPPVAVSAMDGYAVRAADVATLPARLTLVGVAPAGGHHDGRVGAGEAVRIFTGGPLPAGADCVVIQENVRAAPDGTLEVVDGKARPGANIRAAGLDFVTGDQLLRAGRVLTARDLGLAAAMGFDRLPLRRRPRIALLTTGNELVPAGSVPGPDQIVDASAPMLAASVSAWGGQSVPLGIAADRIEALKDAFARAAGCDLLVTAGGASVGEHDLVQRALGEMGVTLDFWKVALRPGKPLMFGRAPSLPVLGLPGNPVSAYVCALLFLRPALARMLGRPVGLPLTPARLGRDLGPNDQRQDYLRASLTRGPDGTLVATPSVRQDSSMLAPLAAAGALLLRAPGAPAAIAGDPVLLLLPDGETATEFA